MSEEKINGIENEIQFINYFNKKRIKELSPMHYSFLKDLFQDIEDNDIIKCRKNNKPQKYDIFICINDKIKRISIKKGIKNSVHVERISDFIHFLIDNKINKNIIIEYLKYHYADGTTNGKGAVRVSSIEYKKTHQDKINKINEAFNNINLINKATDKFVLKGNNSDESIDAIIHGTVNDFVWILEKDIKNIISSQINIYSTAIHFGPLIVQPLDRCLNKNPLYEKKRFCVQIKWYNLYDSIIENMNSKYIKSKVLSD